MSDKETKEIIDARTGEIIPLGEIPSAPPITEQHTKIDLSMIGTLDTSSINLDALREPLDENDVQIRPDGMVYLPWTWRSKRYNNAFGELAWALIPQGAPMSRQIDENNVLVVWGQWLVVKGHPIGFSYGECAYRPKNRTMSYGDACEGAKSNAISRIGKQLGMPDLDLWDAGWVAEWKRKYAAYIKNPDGDYPKMIWVRKDDRRYQASKSDAPPSPKKKENPAKREVPPTPKAKPVDEEFPKAVASQGAMVDEAKEQSEGFTPAQLRKQVNIEELKKLSGKTIPEILNVINAIPKGEKRTIGQIVKELTQDV